MFIYRVWALFVVASLSAASSSSKKTTSVAGTSGLTSAKVERHASILQHSASQPVIIGSPVSPDGPLVSPSIRRVASMYSASAPAGARAIESPRRLDFTGFGCAVNIEESGLSQSVLEPHLKSTRKGRIGELLYEEQPIIRKEKLPELEEDSSTSLESVEAASDLDEYFGISLE